MGISSVLAMELPVLPSLPVPLGWFVNPFFPDSITVFLPTGLWAPSCPSWQTNEYKRKGNPYPKIERQIQEFICMAYSFVLCREWVCLKYRPIVLALVLCSCTFTHTVIVSAPVTTKTKVLNISITVVFTLRRSWDWGLLVFIWVCSFPGYLSCCRFLDDNQIVTSSGDTTWWVPGKAETEAWDSLFLFTLLGWDFWEIVLMTN